MTITTEQIAELRRLCAETTPGPWKKRPTFHGDQLVSVVYDNDWKLVTSTDENNAFIAAARSALPALLDALSASEQAREQAEADAAAYRKTLDWISRQFDVLTDSEKVNKLCFEAHIALYKQEGKTDEQY